MKRSSRRSKRRSRSLCRRATSTTARAVSPPTERFASLGRPSSTPASTCWRSPRSSRTQAHSCSSARASSTSRRADHARLTRTAGHVVTATHVIVATHAPILDKKLLPARAKAERGYALAIEDARAPSEGMFISASSPSHSVRGAAVQGPRGADRLRRRATRLASRERTARREQLAAARAVGERRAWRRAGALPWSTQDYSSLDRLPFIGAIDERARIFTATAFGGWGMTSGTAAAMLLRDLVVELENPWAELYDPGTPRAASRSPRSSRKGAHDAKRLVGDRLGRRASGCHRETLAAGQRPDREARRREARRLPRRATERSAPSVPSAPTSAASSPGTTPSRAGTAPATALASRPPATCCKARRRNPWTTKRRARGGDGERGLTPAPGDASRSKWRDRGFDDFIPTSRVGVDKPMSEAVAARQTR